MQIVKVGNSYVVLEFENIFFNNILSFMSDFVILYSYTSEILEIQADDPSLHVLFVPGNPGVASIVCSSGCYVFHVIMRY